jgi:hypothetical protein
MKKNVTTMGHDFSCSYFRQLNDGRWAASNMSSTYVSVEHFAQGAAPDRFKWLECVKASNEEATEYWGILEKQGYFKDNEDDSLMEMKAFYGELY